MLLVRVQVLEGFLTSQPSVHVWKAKGCFSHYPAHGNELPRIMQVMQKNTLSATDTENFQLCEHLLVYIVLNRERFV